MGFVRRLRRHPASALLALVLTTIRPSVLDAQTTSASVSGAVQDAQGGVLPGVTVTMTSRTQGNALTAVTDASGRFVFPIVRPDTYTLQATLQGFKTLERTNVVVNANDKLSAGALTLEVGAIDRRSQRDRAASIELQSKSGERSFTLESDDAEEHRQQRPHAVQLRDAGARRAVAEHRQHRARLGQRLHRQRPAARTRTTSPSTASPTSTPATTAATWRRPTSTPSPSSRS